VTVERGKVVEIDASSAAPSTGGYICGKVRRFDRRLYSAERILHPARTQRAQGRSNFEPVTGMRRLDLIAERMTDARGAAGRRIGAALLLRRDRTACSRSDLEDARFFRRFGASRLARTLCAAPTGAAATAMYGKMPGVAYEDYEAARLIVVWGATRRHPASTWSRTSRSAETGRQSSSWIDPRRTPLARIADLHLAVRPARIFPWRSALIRDLFVSGRADRAFLDRHADGIDELRTAADPWTLERAAVEAGIAIATSRRCAEWYADDRAGRRAVRLGTGTQSQRRLLVARDHGAAGGRREVRRAGRRATR
jgi:anaerobic selenocysteine-containing dehydrogenase